uniref:DUF4371 domain-containing protein n=1 Tax=Triticum urartu TaxID=4572 RepID=A0A8R7RAE7_TRIUA
MAVVCRFPDKEGLLQERFFDLIHVKNTKALTLKEELSALLSNNGFDVQNLRGQGYDGASNMKSEFNGLQALFLKDCLYAYYVHCYAHRLQLALVAVARDVVPISKFFQKLLYIINIVDSSSKRHDAQVVEIARLLAIDQIETSKGGNQIKALKRPGDTRWGSRLGSISSLMDMFNAVSSTLQTIASDASDGTHRADADTAYNYLIDFEFVFGLCMMREILEISEELGKALQKKRQGIVNAIHLLSSTKALLVKLRSDNGWDDFFTTIVEFCMDHGIEIPDMDEPYWGHARRQADNFTKEHYFRAEIFRATLNSQLNELNLKFNEKVMGLLSVSVTLIPKNRFACFNAKDICKMVEKFYLADFTHQELIALERQLNHFASDASNNEDLKKPTTLIALCRCLFVTGRYRIYNMVDRLIRFLITLPVSTTSVECAFSSLKIIKTRLHNTMEDEYLANSLLIQVERELATKFNFEDIIADFKDRKKRRANL